MFGDGNTCLRTKSKFLTRIDYEVESTASAILPSMFDKSSTTALMSLIVMLVVFLVPAHVFAECSWVLWHKQHRKMVMIERLEDEVRWDPQGTSDSKAQCQAAQEREIKVLGARLKMAHSDKGDVDTSQPDRIVQTLREGGYVKDTFICFPDSVDPRR